MKFVKGCLMITVLLGLAGILASVITLSQDSPPATPRPTTTEDASVAAIAADPEIARLDREARAIPAVQAQKNLEAYQELLRRVPASARYKSKVAHYSRAAQTQLVFEIVDEERYDAPIKTQVVRYIVVPEKATKDQLRALVERQYAEIRGLTGFKHARTPTHVGVYVFDTEEKAKAQQGGALAYTFMTDASAARPKITFDDVRLANAWTAPEVKGGRTEAERREIWTAAIKASDRAMAEAERKHPQDFQAQAKLMRELEERYKREVRERYGTTAEEMTALSVEGYEKGWPMPEPVR